MFKRPKFSIWKELYFIGDATYLSFHAQRFFSLLGEKPAWEEATLISLGISLIGVDSQQAAVALEQQHRYSNKCSRYLFFLFWDFLSPSPPPPTPVYPFDKDAPGILLIRFSIIEPLQRAGVIFRTVLSHNLLNLNLILPIYWAEASAHPFCAAEKYSGSKSWAVFM